MANPTTNYGWPMPTATDLVTDLPADFAAFGQPVDTSLKALNPETTLGDIAYRSATSNTNTRLAIGSTGNVLTVSGGVPAWAAPAGGGKLLQVVNVAPSTSFTTTSTSFVDATNVTASITPTLNTSKVLVIFNYQSGCSGSGTNQQISSFQVLRGATVLGEAGINMSLVLGSSQTIELFGRGTFVWLDSPATTSSTTYKLQIKAQDVNMTAAAQKPSSITLMEIGA
jgi:hypothetical protein